MVVIETLAAFRIQRRVLDVIDWRFEKGKKYEGIKVLQGVRGARRPSTFDRCIRIQIVIEGEPRILREFGCPL